MKLALAFTVFNKEQWLEGLLCSWVSRLSGSIDYEIIVVCDGCTDRSAAIARAYLRERSHPWIVLENSRDRYEVFCNNQALKLSTADYIVMIQDDNWMYDDAWDVTLVDAFSIVPRVGVVGLLAGLEVEMPESCQARRSAMVRRCVGHMLRCRLRDIWVRNYGQQVVYRRIEADRCHKGENFRIHNLPRYDMGVWCIDVAIRPLAVNRRVALALGGFDNAFQPLFFDDYDLALKLQMRGRSNLYVPFDVVNLSASVPKGPRRLFGDAYGRGMAIIANRYRHYLRSRPQVSAHRIADAEPLASGRLVLSGCDAGRTRSGPC